MGKHGVGYGDAECCRVSTVAPATMSPTRKPTKSPTAAVGSTTPTFSPTFSPSSSPTGLPTHGPAAQPTGCLECTDEPSDWMAERSKLCSTYADGWLLACNQNAAWIENKLCQYTCSKHGVGYGDAECCQVSTVAPATMSPTRKPTKSPTRAPHQPTYKEPYEKSNVQSHTKPTRAVRLSL